MIVLFIAGAVAACGSGHSPKQEGGVASIDDVQAFYLAMEGEWRGGYDLWVMPTAPKESSESTARITTTSVRGVITSRTSASANSTSD